MTWKELTDAGLFWVVTRIKYEVIETPQLHEQVIARTWPLAPTRLGFQREYTMRKLDGTPLVKCSSDWILMDYQTRSFASARDFYKGPQDFSEEKVFDKKLRKIKTFEPEEQGVEDVVSFVDIDINGHVNNSKYPNFVMNALELSENETIKTFQIDYRHELRLGDRVRVHSNVMAKPSLPSASLQKESMPENACLQPRLNWHSSTFRLLLFYPRVYRQAF